MLTLSAARTVALGVAVILATTYESLFVTCANAAESAYPDAPSILVDGSHVVADRIVHASKKPNVPHPEAELSGEYELLVFYAVADAVTPKQAALAAPVSIRQLEARKYASELQRVDKQIGAPPSASGSTSLLEKAGLVDLLGFAVEHGAVLREDNGTSTTFSATPYSLLTLQVEDTASAYNRYDLLRRVEVSGSVKLNSDTSSQQGIDFKKFEQWSVRIRLWGDRSTRSREFEDKWNTNVRSKIEPILADENAVVGSVLDHITEIRVRANALDPTLRDTIAAYLASSTDKADSVRIEHVQDIILRSVHDAFYAPIIADPSLVTIEQRKMIVTQLVPRLDHRKKFDEVPQAADAIIKEAEQSDLVTLSYTDHLVDNGSDYSEVKLLAEGTVPFPDLPRPDLIVNGSVALNHDPQHTTKIDQHTIRSYSVAGSLQWAADNVIGVALMGALQKGTALTKDKMTIAVSGRYERTEDQDANIWLAQGRIAVPITPGVSLPLSITYASRTELVDEKEVRGNFGITVDTDKLVALAHLAAAGS